jgi:catalase
MICCLIGLTDGAALPAAETAAAPAVQPNEVVDSLEATYGIHPGKRRNHTKGTCATGEFVGTPDAVALSRSLLFAGQAIPVIARFSIAGGNPTAADSTENPRGMALEFRLPDGYRQHMTMLNTPVFGAANPNTFNDLLLASRPDPGSGRADPAKLRQFLATHPDALAQSSFLMSHRPPRSYANETYYGVHTFQFIDGGGHPHPVKWRFIPLDGEKRMTAAELSSAPRDFVEKRLIERVAAGPVQWEMMVYVGEPGDSEDNATLTWPETRRHFRAGTLTISHATAQSGAECEKLTSSPP